MGSRFDRVQTLEISCNQHLQSPSWAQSLTTLVVANNIVAILVEEWELDILFDLLLRV